ncbi:MAG: ABC transporter ATP-binding protein [Fusobacteriaceae bacterium]
MDQCILKMENIRKTFVGGKVIANDCINLNILKGEKHAIVGENGAGKSTLMKILNGLYQPTSGKIILNGKETIIDGPSIAAELGIGMVYQHFMLVPTLTVAENMILGVEPKKGMFLDLDKARKDVIDVSHKYGLDIEPNALIKDLSVGMQQRIEILKILFKGANLLVFDEPTAVLTPQETKELYKIIDNLIAEGKTIIFISHKLEEVLAISDNITVIRRGKNISNFKTSKATKEMIANAMVGRAVLFTTKKPIVKIGKEILTVKNVSLKNNFGVMKVENVSFSIREGEVLGLAGVEGSGQTELIEALTGLMKIEKGGEIKLSGNIISNIGRRKLDNAGIAHIPEDRHKRAGIAEYNLMENFALGQHETLYSKKRFLINFEKIKSRTLKYILKYDVRPAEPELEFGKFSGGNQQKIIVARELEKKNLLIIAAQPTRGVDIGAIESIHKMLLLEKEKGKALLVVSSELSEIMNLSDKIAVMCAGHITGILNREEATEEKIGILMAGGKINE